MTFVIEGAPRTKKNHQMIARTKAGKPFVMQARTARDWENAAQLQLQAQLHRYRGVTRHDDERWNMAALVYRDRDGRADLLNYLAAVSDALERAGVVTDDRTILGLDGSRLLIDRARPRVEITLTPLGA